MNSLYQAMLAYMAVQVLSDYAALIRPTPWNIPVLHAIRVII
jgi:hypothetical protein